MGFIYNDDLGRLVLRVNLGFLFLFHGAGFLRGQTNILTNTDPVPDFIIWPLAVLAEVASPIAAILGVYSRAGAFFMAAFMVAAILLRHTFGDLNHWFMVEGDAYRLEAQFFLLWSSVAVVFLGAGKYSLKIGGKWN